MQKGSGKSLDSPKSVLHEREENTIIKKYNTVSSMDN